MTINGILTSFFFALLAVPPAAEACSCAPSNPQTPTARKQYLQRQLRASAAVFLGEVVAVDRFAATFRVEKIWKGSLETSIVLGTGTDIGPSLWVVNTCTLNFQGSRGRRYVVFADADRFGRLSAHRCGATVPVSHAIDIARFLDGSMRARPPLDRLPTAPHPELAQIFGPVLEEVAPTTDDEVFAGVAGPYPAPRPGLSLGCGTGYKIRLRRHARGWILVEHTSTMC